MPKQNYFGQTSTKAETILKQFYFACNRGITVDLGVRVHQRTPSEITPAFDARDDSVVTICIISSPQMMMMMMMTGAEVDCETHARPILQHLGKARWPTTERKSQQYAINSSRHDCMTFYRHKRRYTPPIHRQQ